ncbi:MAG TPA: BolA family transcriptional regulator [Terriglobales bacterium]|nr:BolA family transcriptional regulator [Terriglobales bacterium]
MSRVEAIEDILRRAFAPIHLTIADESDRHRGHAGAAGGGGHFRATIVSESFRGLNAVARQRAVYQALGDAMRGEIHALSLQTLTPEEWQRKRG